MPTKWLVGGGAVLALLWLANSCENATLRRRALLAAGDSVAALHSQSLDSAALAHFDDTVRLRRQMDSLARVRQRVRVVTIARTDTLREALPDTLRPVLDSVIAGYETQLAVKDSAFAILQGASKRSDSLLVSALGNRDEWRTQAHQWRKEATRWTLRLGPFSVRPVVGYGLTSAGTGAFVGVGLTP